jgi:anti-sigma factor RsiW
MTNRPYLPCTEIIGFLADYLDGELDADRRSEFDRHLAVCPSCVAYLETYKETIRMAKAAELPPAEVVDEAPEDLIKAILAASGA